MGNLLEASVQIYGTRTILWNHLKPTEDFGKRREKSGTAGNDPSEWERSVLMTKERQLYLLPTYVFGCLRDAGKYTKKGKSSLMSAIASTLQVVERRILLDRYVPETPEKYSEEVDDPVYIYVAIVRNIATRGRNIRYRVAASPGWQCCFTLLFDKTIVSRTEMEAVVIDAGKLVGLADGRSLGFGRFALLQFSVKD
jgi:hypothetical protein